MNRFPRVGPELDLMHAEPTILYEDNHLLAVNKPAGLATMGVEAGQASLATWAKDYLKRQYNKPGNVYLGVMSRLDAAVSGVVLLARTSKAAARMTEQFRTRKVHKTYWAIAGGVVNPPQGNCDQWVLKDESRHRMIAVPAGTPTAQHALLSYRRRALVVGDSLLEVELETGRKHQIRLQLAELGHAVLGDRKYGSQRSFPHGIALHARRLAIEHPTTRSRLEFTAPPPAYWPKLPPIE